ncbi:hypothetical protein [Actibacterium pelagium]|uniref:Uncharacterized protein n=1 Tax=Actibacterium pelagium TaxID=2029103 RepID=A0A917AN50_9RHOB|nr:hypothetical protein [Actibacterium pelagium]GGE62933.1 hypothetical protein GCM10011517_33330 [Actibacterium pelagium]
MSDDQMETAILRALELVPAANTALNDLDHRFDSRERWRVHEFCGRLDAGKIFEDRDIYDLEDLLAPIQAEIELGWMTHWVHDENHAAGGWSETILLPAAAELEAKTRPLSLLRDALVLVRNLRRTEDVLIKMLEQRHR